MNTVTVQKYRRKKEWKEEQRRKMEVWAIG